MEDRYLILRKEYLGGGGCPPSPQVYDFDIYTVI
jgi:hypothetical protein